MIGLYVCNLMRLKFEWTSFNCFYVNLIRINNTQDYFFSGLFSVMKPAKASNPFKLKKGFQRFPFPHTHKKKTVKKVPNNAENEGMQNCFYVTILFSRKHSCRIKRRAAVFKMPLQDAQFCALVSPRKNHARNCFVFIYFMYPRNLIIWRHRYRQTRL